MDSLHRPLLAWYDTAARDLPWREPTTTPWGVLVSEVMLGQTPVNRVLPVYREWLARWPTPAALAAEPAGEAVRHWGRLGYPRRALRLHAAARTITAEYGGEVPDDVALLLRLPGVGEYTARAVAAFAFGRRVAVVDTNVRRVHARAVLGQGAAGPPSVRRDLANVDALLPDDPPRAARFSVALMEFGALVCMARTPRCADCVIVADCAWQAAGRPAYDGPASRPQPFTGTDRQVRGLILRLVRDATDPVPREAIEAVWAEPVQRDRALQSLLADGLLTQLPGERYALPGS